MIAVTIADHLADAWRWWTVPGAFLGCWLLAPRIYGLALAIHIDLPTHDLIFPAHQRLGAFMGAFIFMLAVIIAGSVIPLATDRRIEGFSEAAPLFRVIFCVVWFLFGCAAWGIAASLAPRWRWITIASVMMWIAAFAATYSMQGAML